MTLPTPLPGRLQLRVSTSSGTVTVVADERDDVVVEEGGDVGRSVGGVVEVRPVRSSSSVTVRCPTGTDLVAGTVSGGVKLKGRLGSVSVTSSSGSIRVGAVTEADLRTGSGSVRVAECDQACRVSTTSGTVTVAGTGRADISTVSGSIVVERVNGEISARTVSGEVSLVTEAHGPVKARSVSGGIAVRVPAGVRPAVKVSGRGRLVSDCDAGDDVTIEVTTTSGTVEISRVLMPGLSTSTAVVTGAIVFTDLVGFTEFTALSGDDAALELLAAQSRLVDEVLPPDARVVKELGDGLLLFFPDPAEAVQAGLDLQRAFEAESESTGMPLWIRVGMHAGAVRERGRDLVGHDVNVAARIVDVAGAGEVLVSDAVRRDAQPRIPTVEFLEIGPVVMKGIPDPIRLWRVSCP